MKTELWKEFIANAAEESGELLKETTIDAIVDCVEGIIENMWMIDGPAPTPARPVRHENIDALKDEIKRLEEQIFTYRRSVAIRRHVPIEDVYIEDGTVIYGKSL